MKCRTYGNAAKLEIAEVDNPLRFQGQYHDAETGLHYNRHRYYNPNTGSYLTPDPIKLAGGLNNYQYVPNPTGWVDPLGLARTKGSCPGEDGGQQGHPSHGEPAVPFPEKVEWTPHWHKHVPLKNMDWKDTINSTKTGPAKYKPGTNIEEMERSVYESGMPATNGKSWKIQEFDTVVGASEGKPSRWIRVEQSAGVIHGHPISEREFRKLTK